MKTDQKFIDFLDFSSEPLIIFFQCILMVGIELNSSKYLLSGGNWSGHVGVKKKPAVVSASNLLLFLLPRRMANASAKRIGRSMSD